MKRQLFLYATMSSIFLTGCVTEFKGSPYVSRDQCEKWCVENGLECSGMMALGAYSSGCICSKPKTSAKITETDGAQGAAAAAVAMISAKRQRENVALMTTGVWGPRLHP